MRLLLVEDHVDLRVLTVEHLAERGFIVDAVGNLADARHALASYSYDALLIDVGLPDGCGLSLVRNVEARRGVPAILLTARDDPQDRINGLNAGADDYVAKPFDVDELEARLRAVLRRPGRRAAPMLRLSTLAFDTVTREASIDGRAVGLGRREADLLERLMRVPGRILSKDAIENGLYADAVTPNALEAVVSRLRRRIAGAVGVRLSTLRGVGYGLALAEPAEMEG